MKPRSGAPIGASGLPTPSSSRPQRPARDRYGLPDAPPAPRRLPDRRRGPHQRPGRPAARRPPETLPQRPQPPGGTAAPAEHAQRQPAQPHRGPPGRGRLMSPPGARGRGPPSSCFWPP